MKRIILLALTLLAATSCVLDSYENKSNRNGRNLKNYADNIFGSFVEVPVNDLIFMLVLDEFLQLPEEEKNAPEWEVFRSRLEQNSATKITVPSKGIAIDTKGTGIKTPGSYWLIEITDVYNHSYDYRYGYYYWYESDHIAPGHSKIQRITCTAENQYHITDDKGGSEIMNLVLTAVPSQYGGFDFSGTGSGIIAENDNSLSATYEFQNFYYKRYRQTDDGTGNSSVTVSYSTESLEFRLDTYHKGLALDWYMLNISPGEEIKYDSNLPYDSQNIYE